MKLRASAIAAMTIAGVLCAGAGAYYFWTESQVGGYVATPVTPGAVTLIGLDPKSGYKILVANDVAQLAEVQEKRAAVSSGDNQEEAKNLKRIPIREFLGSLQGKTEDLGRLVMALNSMSEDETTGAAAVWKAEDIRKALDGDPTLKAQLERDIHMGLDGTPPGEIRLGTLLGGITVDSPVTIKVPIRGEVKSFVCRVREPFMTSFAHEMERKVGEKVSPNKEMIIGMYQDLVTRVKNHQPPVENIVASLQNVVDPARLQKLAVKPEALLTSATVLINEDHIRFSKYSEWSANDRKQYADITLGLTHDGKMRLWKYSHRKGDFQLMFVVNGVALAAPQITSVLSQEEITIRQLPNLLLARNANDFIQSKAKSK